MNGKYLRHCEDSLTTSVFGHLLHLPVEMFWAILSRSCYTDRLPRIPEEPLEISFFPNWDPRGTANANRVVPDVFIRFESFDLIIEAKRWDERMQGRGQWEKEFSAYLNEYADDHKRVYLLALGGVWEHDATELKAGERICPVFMCRWRRILDESQKVERELKRLRTPSSQSSAVVRILKDVVDLFACHGFSTGNWFSDFDFARYRLTARLSPETHVLRFRKKGRTP